MPIRRSGTLLTVEAEVSHYCIEPIRFTLGKSRVEMVDEHLAELTRNGRGTSADVDELLDARAMFMTGRHDYVVASWSE
jgi:hypothetical protein